MGRAVDVCETPSMLLTEPSSSSSSSFPPAPSICLSAGPVLGTVSLRGWETPLSPEHCWHVGGMDLYQAGWDAVSAGQHSQAQHPWVPLAK